jgi:hypothetical protein
MTMTPQAAPPSIPGVPGTPRSGVATLSRELADFLVEFSITLNKHAIYPSKHPLLDVAIDGVANRVGLLFDENRDSLSIGVARKQLIIEGVATDPQNPVLKELAQRLHKHHIGAIKFIRGMGRDELAAALAELALDPIRTEKPLGHDLDRISELWQHVRFFPLTYDRLQLIEDDENAEAPSPDQMAAGRATQLWIGLARAALVSDTGGAIQRDDSEDNAALEPASVARAIDEHQREEAYDQVIVGYLLQIGEELRTTDGPESLGLQRRVSRLVASLKKSTLEKLLEMGGDKAQRRKFLLDASQGITVEAVIDLVKAASAAEGQTVSHSMLRMLTKLGHHPSLGGPRERTDPTVRDVMRRLIDDWSLDDPNPEAYRQVLESVSNTRNTSTRTAEDVSRMQATECEPERMIQIAIEVGAMGPQVYAAMTTLVKAGRIDVLMNLIERAPNSSAAAPIWDFLLEEQALDVLLAHQRIDLALVSRLAHRIGKPAAPPLLDSLLSLDDAKIRAQFYDLLYSLGDGVAATVAARIPHVPPTLQRELLAFLGRFPSLPQGFSPSQFLVNPEPLIRREAVKLLIRDQQARDEIAMTALSDEDDRVVFVGLTAAQERCPEGALDLLKERVDRGELDSQLRTMCIRIIGQHRSQETLEWLLSHVLTQARWPRRPKLRTATPEMLAALGVVASVWADDPAASAALNRAAQSKEAQVRGKLRRGNTTDGKGVRPA